MEFLTQHRFGARGSGSLDPTSVIREQRSSTGTTIDAFAQEPDNRRKNFMDGSLRLTMYTSFGYS